MAFRKKGAAPVKQYKHHKNDRCFRCRERFEIHGSAKDKQGKVCQEFEYIPPSSRKQTGPMSDVLFSAAFQSETSAKIHVVIAWKQGDYSCNCTGWAAHRNCKHCDMVAANPDHYKGKQDAAINGGAGSVVGIRAELSAKMKAAEEAAKRGDTVELDKLQAEIEMNRDMLEAAGASLGDQFRRMRDNIREHVYGVEPKTPQAAPQVSTPSQPLHVRDADDPFAE